MKTHAEVHEAIEQLCHGTTLTEFMIETKSFRHDDGTVTVEWACCVGIGRRYPEFYFRALDPDTLVKEARDGINRRRPLFAIKDKLSTLRGEPPNTISASMAYHPTGEF